MKKALRNGCRTGPSFSGRPEPGMGVADFRDQLISADQLVLFVRIFPGMNPHRYAYILTLGLVTSFLRGWAAKELRVRVVSLHIRARAFGRERIGRTLVGRFGVPAARIPVAHAHPRLAGLGRQCVESATLAHLPAVLASLSGQDSFSF